VQRKNPAVDQEKHRVQVAPKNPKNLNREAAEAEKNSAVCTVGKVMAHIRQALKDGCPADKPVSAQSSVLKYRQANPTSSFAFLNKLFYGSDHDRL
jgi:hypothetical protein